jgi:hypothetical protein
MSFARPDRPPDWADTVSGLLRQSGQRAREVFHEALAQPPAWLGIAMAVRTVLMRPFGVKTSLPGQGHFLARMPVVADTDTHFETGLDDRHLTFTLATRLEERRVHVTTSIWFNSPLGRLYLFAVMPGHILATRQMVGRVATDLVRRRGEPREGMTP